MVTKCGSARATATTVVSRGAAVSTVVASAASAAASATAAAMSAAWGFAKTAAYFCIGCVGELKDI